MEEQEQQVEAVPEGIPSFLVFRPSQEAFAAHQELLQLLSQVDRKIQTATHLNTKQVQETMNLPLFAASLNWTIHAQSDLVRWVYSISEYLVGRSEPAGLDEEIVENLTGLFDDIQTALGETTAFLGALENEKAKTLAATLQALVAEIDEARESLEEEEEPEEEEGEDEDEEEEEEEEEVTEPEPYTPIIAQEEASNA